MVQKSDNDRKYQTHGTCMNFKLVDEFRFILDQFFPGLFVSICAYVSAIHEFVALSSLILSLTHVAWYKRQRREQYRHRMVVEPDRAHATMFWLYFCRVLALSVRRNRSCSLHKTPDSQLPPYPQDPEILLVFRLQEKLSFINRKLFLQGKSVFCDFSQQKSVGAYRGKISFIQRYFEDYNV